MAAYEQFLRAQGVDAADLIAAVAVATGVAQEAIALESAASVPAAARAAIDAARAMMSMPAVYWDPRMSVVAFTDGGCANNGRPDARASYSICVAGGVFGSLENFGTQMRGLVAPSVYELAGDRLVATGAPATPSNNRAELMAIIRALMLLAKVGVAEAEIVSDSLICVNTLTDWLPKRLANGTAHELKNGDLLMVAWALLQRVRCVFTHVRGHAKAPPHDAPSAEVFLYKGNFIVDRGATQALTDRATFYFSRRIITSVLQDVAL
jgi:ribonuclease HI